MAETDAQKLLPSQENLLLDCVHRLEKLMDGRRAVHILLSGLRPINRREQHIRAAANAFEGMVKDQFGQLFVLKNSDLFFIYKGQTHHHAETAVQKARYLFSDDPLLEEDEGRNFATWYDVETQFDELLHRVQELV